MPVGFVPSKNAAHRLACLSLYRSLLQQCTVLTRSSDACRDLKPTPGASALTSLVRHRFKKDKRFNNKQQIRDAIRSGRTILELLQHATTGSHAALESLGHIVSACTNVAVRKVQLFEHKRDEQSQRQLPKKIVERKEREAFLADKANYRRQPDTVPVLERPVPYEDALKHKDGRRRVPDHFVAQGIPFLRYTHRQPLSLGRQMMWEIKAMEKLWDRKTLGTENIALAELEDTWDREMWNSHRVYQSDLVNERDEKLRWEDSPRASLRDDANKMHALDAKRMTYSSQLFDVYLKEQELARSENMARKAGNRKTWLQEQAEEVSNDRKETKRVAALFGDPIVDANQVHAGRPQANFNTFSSNRS